MAEKKKGSKASESTNSDAKVNFRLKRMSLNVQTKLFTFGIALPLGLVWLGTYLMFTFPALLKQIEAFLANFPAEQSPALYTNILLPLNANSGLGYYAIGIFLYLLAAVLARQLGNRFNLTELKLGEVRVRSLLMSTLVSLIVAAVVVSLANRALFDPLLALQGI